jgi:MFS transporter, DHA1 family, multidrug resistance protein
MKVKGICCMPKKVAFVLLSVFMLVLGAFISGTILTPYAKSLGGTWLSVGVLSSSMYVVRLFVGVPIGRLADRKGTLTVLKYSLILFPFIAIVYWVSGNVPALIGARLFHGLASAMLLPMAMAYLGQVSPEGEEGRYMSIYNAVFLAASGIGPLISTMLADRFHSYRVTFISLFVLAVLALIILLASLKINTGSEIHAKPGQTVEMNRISTAALYKNTGLLALSLIYIALAVISSLIGFFILPFLTARGIPLLYAGMIIAIYNLVSGMIQIPFGRLSDRYDKYRITMLAGIVTSAALLLFPATNNPWVMAIAIAVIAIGSAALLSASSAFSAIVGRETGMGSSMGFLNTANSAGMIFGCISLSLMPYTPYGFEAFFFLSGSITIVCTVLFSVLWSRKLKIDAGPPVRL